MEYNSKIIDDLMDDISPLEFKKTEMKMVISAKISDSMKDKGMTKRDLSKAIEWVTDKQVSLSTINKMLSGTYNFTVDEIVEFELILDIKFYL